MKENNLAKIALFCILLACWCIIGMLFFLLLQSIDEERRLLVEVSYILVYVVDILFLGGALYVSFQAILAEELKKKISLIEKLFCLLLTVGTTIFYVNCVACLWNICNHAHCSKQGYIPLIIIIVFFLFFLGIKKMAKDDCDD